MKRNRFGLILIGLLMMAAGVTVMYSCTGDETPTTTLAPDDPADGRDHHGGSRCDHHG